MACINHSQSWVVYDIVFPTLELSINTPCSSIFIHVHPFSSIFHIANCYIRALIVTKLCLTLAGLCKLCRELAFRHKKNSWNLWGLGWGWLWNDTFTSTNTYVPYLFNIGIYWNILEYIGIYWNILEYLFNDNYIVLEYIGMTCFIFVQS